MVKEEREDEDEGGRCFDAAFEEIEVEAEAAEHEVGATFGRDDFLVF